VLDYVPLPEKTQVSDSFVGFSAIATGTPEPSDGCGITSFIIYIRVERSRNGARLLPETVAVRLWDGRFWSGPCTSSLRPCPTEAVTAGLRALREAAGFKAAMKAGLAPDLFVGDVPDIPVRTSPTSTVEPPGIVCGLMTGPAQGLRPPTARAVCAGIGARRPIASAAGPQGAGQSGADRRIERVGVDVFDHPADGGLVRRLEVFGTGGPGSKLVRSRLTA
jgi:hypothetical protein